MLNIGIDIKGLDKLQKHIDFVNKLLKMKTDKSFQKFIQNKVMDVAKMITDKELTGGTSNDEEIGLYKSSHHIQDIDNGFILYNDAKIPADKYNILPFDTSGYPNGQFSIALAFEYGVGIVGSGSYTNDKFEPWQYNVISTSKSTHKNENGWYLPKSVYEQSGILYSGYQGFGIYRNIAIEIENKLNDWVIEYYKKEVK